MAFEWGIIAFAIGIGIYFALPTEPPVWAAWSLALIAAALLICVAGGLFGSLPKAGIIIGLIAMVALGSARGVLHTQAIKAPVLPDYSVSYDVTGWIEAVERSGTGYRWRIRVDEITRRFGKPPPVPKRIRVRTKRAGFVPGDAVSLRAILKSPPGPVIADGYDPARRAWFEQVGAYGFAISTPQAAQIKTRGYEDMQRRLARFREHLTARILRKAPPATAGLQAALLTGDRAYIDPAQTEVLRASGLAHVLAISGLHMGLMAGGAFWLVSFVLSAIDPIARRYDVRKAAALVGIIVAAFYLILSGSSVSTQRAFIMAVVLFGAILLSRPAISMRTVAVAAAITLALHPESLVSAGFQMSFAAAAALVSFYSAWRERFPAKYAPGILRRGVNNMTGLAATSAIAGVATGGFAAIHFHQVARLGFFANLVAMPFFTFIVMPAGFAAFLALPFGLEAAPLAVMGWGLEQMLWMAEKITGLQRARTYFTAAPAYMAGAFGLAFAFLCLGPNRMRACAIVAIAGLWSLWAMNTPPDMRVSDSADIAFWDRTEQGSLLYVERTRADGYGVAQFMERAGDPDADIISYTEQRADCDARACELYYHGRHISVAGSPEIADEECKTADLVILTERSAGPVTRRNCKAVLIDARYLEMSGAQDIYFRPSGEIDLKPANPKRRKNRPWGVDR